MVADALAACFAKLAELSRIKLKNLNSTARLYDQQAFSPLYPTAVWHLHLVLAICMFVVFSYDAMAQASDFQIERRLNGDGYEMA